MSDLEISKVRHGRVGEPQLRESTIQCCSPFHIGHDNLSTLSANQYYTSIFYQGCIGIDSKAWPPWHCCKGGGRETAWWGLPCCLCAAEGWEEESISGLDLHSLSFTNKNLCSENWHWFNTWWITAHCSLVRCIHARLLGPSSLQCLATFICGCAIINLSSPENYFFPSKVALPKVRSCKHDFLLSLHFCLSNLFFTANHTCNELFWTEDDNQNTEIRIHDSREQIRNEILRNTTAEMESQKWTNWGWGSGQTGGGARSALATTWIDFSKFWQLPGILHMLQNPTMCVMWGGSSHFFTARSLRSKIPRSGGVRSPDPLPKWVGEPD